MFKDLVTLIQLLAVIPATLATSAERSFSCLRRVKAWLHWSTMTQTRRNSAIMRHANRDVQPDIETVVQEFVNPNDVRRRIFGK